MHDGRGTEKGRGRPCQVRLLLFCLNRAGTANSCPQETAGLTLGRDPVTQRQLGGTRQLLLFQWQALDFSWHSGELGWQPGSERAGLDR